MANRHKWEKFGVDGSHSRCVICGCIKITRMMTPEYRMPGKSSQYGKAPSCEIPNDMLFYYNTTDGETHYFSACYSVKATIMMIIEIEMDELWELVKKGKLKLKEISPADFPYPIPATISGSVKAFII